MSFIEEVKNSAKHVYLKSHIVRKNFDYILINDLSSKKLATNDPDFKKRTEDIGIVPIEGNFYDSFIDKFPEFFPTSLNNDKVSFGMGDRIGNASAAHLNIIKKYDIFPVLAQQSKRELFLSGNRSFKDVIRSASIAAFETNYTYGFAADGDHLKTVDDILNFIELGCTMITIDCSEHIRNILSFSHERGKSFWNDISYDERKLFIQVKKSFENIMQKQISEKSFVKDIWLYYDTIKFISQINESIEKKGYKDISLEISIDENKIETTPFGHWLIADLLKRLGIHIVSIAPRFSGEFQKGIDYIGNLDTFEKNLVEHYQVSTYFGHKISFHSGSDKFSVFPIIEKIVQKPFHIKIAGTNWLEALRVISIINPQLFKEIFQKSSTIFDDIINNKLYIIKTQQSEILSINNFEENEYPELLDQDIYRQFLHVTYSSVLANEIMKKKLDDSLLHNEEIYYSYIENHLKKHLDSLGIKKIDGM